MDAFYELFVGMLIFWTFYNRSYLLLSFLCYLLLSFLTCTFCNATRVLGSSTHFVPETVAGSYLERYTGANCSWSSAGFSVL